MSSNQLPVAALAAACITAAAAGGYFTARNSAVVSTPQAAALDTAPSPAPLPAAQPGAQSVAAGLATAVQPARPDADPPPARTSTPAARQRTQTSAQRPSIDAVSEPAPVVAQRGRSIPTSEVDAADIVPAPPEAPAPAAEAPVVYEPAAWSATPAAPVARDIVVAADSVVGLRMESAMSSERAVVEDRVEARVVRDVRVDDERAIPEGARLIGSVVVVERGGKFKERARLGIRFHTLVLGDRTELPVTTETIYRFGDAVGNRSAAKIGGGAVAGAILGAIVGGSKGAAVGASSGAGAGTAVVMAGDRSEAVFAAGTELTARILAPVTITVED
jgi:hypothetical protein